MSYSITFPGPLKKDKASCQAIETALTEWADSESNQNVQSAQLRIAYNKSGAEVIAIDAEPEKGKKIIDYTFNRDQRNFYYR